MSSVPLIGLIHLVNIYRYSDADDGAGGIIPNGYENKIYKNIDCRISLLSGEDEQKIFGNASGNKWMVVADYMPNIQKSDFLELSSSSQPAPIQTGDKYRVIYECPRFDENGNFHHHSIVVEKE